MKNTITTLILLLCALNSFAQKEKTTIDLEKFTELKAFDQIEVTLIKSDKNQVVLTGDDQGDVNVDNKKGLLKIKMDFENHMDGEDIEAKVYYTEELTLLDANENAKIFSEGTFKSKEVKIAVQEGADVEMKVDIDNLYVKSTSGSAVRLTGSARIQEVVANAGGKVYNKALNTEETKVTVNAGGSAEIKASKKAAAKVRAGGSIYIYGNPKQVDRDKVFGGKIKVMD
ncbi:MAG: head GIN domain-containing protein [Maribacter sp.]|uniref:head GIN domain-containing protein n=1 Tax=Maribacter sp. TaxID=1897614 RepID=UPI003298994E